MTNRRRLPTVARHGRQRRSHAWLVALGVVAATLTVALFSGVSIAAIAVTQLTTTVQSATVHLHHVDGQVAPPGIDAITGGVNLLLVGTDTRTGQGGQFSTKAELAGSSGAGNNDVTILLHIAQDHRSAMIVSFPRDLILDLPSCPSPKGGSYPASSKRMLNSALSRGGLACPVLTIEKLTGVTIPYAASISFDGVAAMSNAVGGVTVCVANSINDKYVGLTLSAGEHTIQGATALAFVRSRHGVGDGSDLGRISSQQVFLSALARKIEGDGVLKNPLQLYGLASAAAQNMQLSDTLARLDTMVSIALALKSIPLQNIVMVQYPTTTSPLYPNRVVPVTSTDAAVNRALVDDLAVTLSGDTGRGSVIDPNAATGAAPTAVPSATAAATPGTASGAPSGSASPTASATTTPPLATIALPASVTGQTAAQQTCAKGRGK